MNTKEPVERRNTDINFWNQVWDEMNLFFHESNLHPMLLKHIQLLLENRECVRFFFPLCGKAWDMRWLAPIGHQVIGIDSNQKALEQFFEEGNIKYRIEENNDFKIYISEGNKIKLYLGDFFKLTTEYEKSFDCVWDRGSLVALPEYLRDNYSVQILKLLSSDFRYLLDTFTYDRALYGGPPHSVDLEEVKRLYGNKCTIEEIDSGTFKGLGDQQKENPIKEIVYLLKPLK